MGLPGSCGDPLRRRGAFDADVRVLEPLTGAGTRYLIVSFFAKIKQCRAIVTRYEKTARNFLAGVQLVANVVWLNLTTRPNLSESTSIPRVPTPGSYAKTRALQLRAEFL